MQASQGHGSGKLLKKISLRFSRPLAGVLLALAVIAVSLIAFSLVGAADSSMAAATSNLRALAGRANEANAASVNGEFIRERAIEIEMASAPLVGRASTRAEILERLINNKLLTQAALEAGIEVSEGDVSTLVSNAIIRPLAEGMLNEEEQGLILATLAAWGIELDEVLDDPGLRAVFPGHASPWSVHRKDGAA